MPQAQKSAPVAASLAERHAALWLSLAALRRLIPAFAPCAIMAPSAAQGWSCNDQLRGDCREGWYRYPAWVCGRRSATAPAKGPPTVNPGAPRRLSSHSSQSRGGNRLGVRSLACSPEAAKLSGALVCPSDRLTRTRLSLLGGGRGAREHLTFSAFDGLPMLPATPARW
jgi:hypothetical protein